MSEFRMTLISDPTLEYPDNANNSFKVRLPSRIVLDGDDWVGSLWSMSVPDAGHRSEIIHSDSTQALMKFGYTVTQRKYARGTWTINFVLKEKEVLLNQVMGKEYPITTGTQLWQNLITKMDQIMFEDIQTAYATLGTPDTVSLKQEWKPTFEWRGDNLVLKAVAAKDAFATTIAKVKPLSKVMIVTELAKKFGLIVKNKDDTHSMGLNLQYTLPQSTFTLATPPTRTNNRFQWVGQHYVGITPGDLLGGTPLLKVTLEDGTSYLHLNRMVEWTITNINAMFNEQVGEMHQTALVYCDVIEPTVVGSQTHSLLRTVELKRSGQGRREIEPVHREWLLIRNTTIESIEVSIGTTNGDLLELSPGKTLVTLGFKKGIKSNE